MSDTLSSAMEMSPPPQAGAMRLSLAHPGDRGVIVEVRSAHQPGDHGIDGEELLRRLLEFGFVEEAAIEVLHEGLIGHDPIVVRLDNMRVALRRRDADEVWFRMDVK